MKAAAIAYFLAGQFVGKLIPQLPIAGKAMMEKSKPMIRGNLGRLFLS